MVDIPFLCGGKDVEDGVRMTEDDFAVMILLVDDDELVLKTLQMLVNSFGYSCMMARDGLEAIEVMTHHGCDLVLSDVIMPNMDGLELLSYVREHFPEVDVIIATGYSESASYAEVIKAGAIDFIKKPIESAELEAKLARALRERRMMRDLERLSMRDALTGLYNRRVFDEKIIKEVERASRQNYQLFLAMVDIDNFKSYNDKYGHPEGDEVLIAMARILQDCTRNSVDFAFRLGGDEFAVLLTETSALQAKDIVQRIQARFAACKFGETSASIGIVSCKRDASLSCEDDVGRMKNRADKAMYEAKKSGKNRVVCWM